MPSKEILNNSQSLINYKLCKIISDFDKFCPFQWHKKYRELGKAEHKLLIVVILKGLKRKDGLIKIKKKLIFRIEDLCLIHN